MLHAKSSTAVAGAAISDSATMSILVDPITRFLNATAPAPSANHGHAIMVRNIAHPDRVDIEPGASNENNDAKATGTLAIVAGALTSSSSPDGILIGVLAITTLNASRF